MAQPPCSRRPVSSGDRRAPCRASSRKAREDALGLIRSGLRVVDPGTVSDALVASMALLLLPPFATFVRPSALIDVLACAIDRDRAASALAHGRASSNRRAIGPSTPRSSPADS